MVIFEADFGCCDNLILGTSPINWDNVPTCMTTAVDWDVKHRLKKNEYAVQTAILIAHDTIRKLTSDTIKWVCICTHLTKILNQYFVVRMKFSSSLNFEIFAPFPDLCLLVPEPRREKTGLRGFRPGPTQIGLYKLRKELEA